MTGTYLGEGGCSLLRDHCYCYYCYYFWMFLLNSIFNQFLVPRCSRLQTAQETGRGSGSSSKPAAFTLIMLHLCSRDTLSCKRTRADLFPPARTCFTPLVHTCSEIIVRKPIPTVKSTRLSICAVQAHTRYRELARLCVTRSIRAVSMPLRSQFSCSSMAAR